MKFEKWFNKKQKELENDPEYLQEYISLLEEQNEYLRKQVKRLVFSTDASQPVNTPDEVNAVSSCRHWYNNGICQKCGHDYREQQIIDKYVKHNKTLTW